MSSSAPKTQKPGQVPPAKPTHPKPTQRPTPKPQPFMPGTTHLPASLRLPKPKPVQPVDKTTETYKQAYQQKSKQLSRRYMGVVCALPILLVTSWALFDRLALQSEKREQYQKLKGNI